MRLAYRTTAILLAAAVLAGEGCGTPTRPPARTDKGSTRATSMPLPSWAPENPSPEFLRAARVLKPMPDASFGSSAPEKHAVLRYYAMTAPAAYEFFGSLTNEQLQKFISSKEIRIPIKQLTAEQRSALDGYFQKKDAAGKDDARMDESLVDLYKLGAVQDLSNVDAGFGTSGHYVFLYLWVRRSDGSVPMFGQTFAYM